MQAAGQFKTQLKTQQNQVTSTLWVSLNSRLTAAPPPGALPFLCVEQPVSRFKQDVFVLSPVAPPQTVLNTRHRKLLARHYSTEEILSATIRRAKCERRQEFS
jgi:hypothetical protein